MIKNALIVINPNSGLRKANRFLTDIVEIFSNNGFCCTVITTTKEKNGKYVVENFGCGKDLIVCCGGDGTFNEVLAGMINHKLDCPIGYIPCGSTNDFATGLGLSKDIIKAAKDIVKGKVYEIDAGNFDGRMFSYVASCGAFTDTSYTTPTDMKNALGHTAYVLEGIKSLPTIKPVKLRINSKGIIYEDQYIFAAICNATTIGGMLKLDNEMVDLNDGLFEVVLIKAPQNMAELTKIIHYINTKNYNNEMIEIFKTDSLLVTPEESIDWSLDGEAEKNKNEVYIQNIHSAFKLIVNK